MSSLSQRVLPVLQLTRMALVFTALADSGCSLFMTAAHDALESGQPFWRQLDPLACMAIAMVSIGLYGFGMSLNDIIDRRRDRQISPGRPLPSGRIGVRTAHGICFLLAVLALAGGGIFASVDPNTGFSFVLVLFTTALITFYDFAAKYLVPLGLLSLGLIRFFHAAVAAPGLPVPWHPLLLLDHVTILSTVAYELEQKRPALRSSHRHAVYFGLLGLNALAIALVWWRRHVRDPDASTSNILTIQPQLFLPLGAVCLFIILAVWIRHTNRNSREAGQRLVLAGLLWLIVYDASFVTAYCGLLAGAMIFSLLPVAYLSVLIMRSWSKMILLSQRPTFKRVETFVE